MKLPLSTVALALAGLLSFSALADENEIRIGIDDIPEHSDQEMVIEGDSVLILDEGQQSSVYSEERMVANVLRKITPSKKGFDLAVTAGREVWLAASSGNNDSSIMRASNVTCYTCLKQAPGQAYRVAGGRKGVAYHINIKGEMWRGNESGWGKLSGAASDIAAGPDGELWHLSKAKTYRNNHDFYRLEGGKWHKLTGNGTSIALGDGIAYAVNDLGEFFTSTTKGRSWKKMDIEGVKAVSADPEGRVYALMNDASDQGYSVRFSDDKGRTWHAMYTVDGYRSSRTIMPLRVWDIISYGDDVWFNRTDGLFAGKIKEMTVNSQNIAMEIVDSRVPVEPFRFQEDAFSILNCSGKDINAKIYHGNDTERTIAAKSMRFSDSKVTGGVSCGSDHCWVELSGVRSEVARLKSGRYVIMHPSAESGIGIGGYKLQKTNNEAQAHGCGLFHSL